MKPTTQQIWAANNTPISVEGEAELPFFLDEECLWTTAPISEDIEEVMLGIDWLQSYECIWDFKIGDLSINGHPAVTLTPHGHTKCQRVLAQEYQEIPPRSQGNVTARITHRNADALSRRPVYNEESEEEVGLRVAATNLNEASSLSETRQKTLVLTEKEMTELQAEDPDIAPILRLRLSAADRTTAT